MRRATTITSQEVPHRTPASTRPSTAWAQGDAYGRALALLTGTIAHDGGEQQAGDYLIGYAVTAAEGMYDWVEGDLEWHDPAAENVHLMISVRDAGDGRFVPALRVLATLISPDGIEVGTHEQPLVWHPMLHHYGRNWLVMPDGDYVLRIRVDPPRFSRHDDVDGLRFMDTVTIEFTGAKVRLSRPGPSQPCGNTPLP
jgi:hypothetical protein